MTDRPPASAAAGGPALEGEATLPRRGFAMVLMVVSSVLISFGGLVSRNIEDADPLQINFYRALAFTAAVLLILAVQYRGNAVARIRGVGRAGLVGGLLLACAGLAFLEALAHTTVANTLFSLSAIPFITAVLARVFLKEGLRRATLVTMIVAAAGICVMMSDGLQVGAGYGNAMALVTALCFSGFAVIVRRNRRVDMMPTLLVSGGILALITLAARLDDLGIPLGDILLCFFWGGVLSGFANGLFIVASRHLVAAEVTLFMMLEFALGPVWVWLFAGEVPTRWSIVGGLLVIMAVTIRALLELRGAGRPLKRGRPSPT
jgi:drug/metabolite transporter (DMT)-like permease